MNRLARYILPAFFTLIVLNAFVWHTLVTGLPAETSSLHFLDVGQGDATLIRLPGDVSVLTDAGPDRSAVAAISAVLPAARHYIDVGIITHPQRDHYGGFADLLRHYRFGAIISNGRNAESGSEAWNSLLKKIGEADIPFVVLGGGARIRYRDSAVEFLAPDGAFLKSKELNDTGLVSLVRTSGFSALLTADTGTRVEEFLVRAGTPLHADILKVGHHGSKYSSGKSFLQAVHPLAALIGVGRNSYGHPTKETLARLDATAIPATLRTDERGTISIVPEGGKLKIYTER
ncbi:MAG: MBL fold metallo-hydrolase [Candidatus Liptonbacteria bacterium]|nr:MBL fold metallo-hydrolase [Candidatus Liptonbacteria bacterium]MBI3114357.1 MBL fold metallo-hydrolase [Candidatus Harrisonbacteria bacterium]